MDIGEQLIRWTIRLSMLCYGVFLVSHFVGGHFLSWQSINRGRRALWVAGAILMVAHVFCAFQFHHSWSNASAVAATAVETEELLGFAFGAGIYFSYVFAAIWVIDAAWWWFRPEQYQARPRWLAMLVHTYIFFIALNGTIVFEAGVTRYGGILVCLFIAGCLVRTMLTNRQAQVTAEHAT